MLLGICTAISSSMANSVKFLRQETNKKPVAKENLQEMQFSVPAFLPTATMIFRQTQYLNLRTTGRTSLSRKQIKLLKSQTVKLKRYLTEE